MEKYKEIGFKLTPQRLAILEFLEGNRKHPSAEEIFKVVSRRFPTMSFATVYNTLETLAERGLLQQLTIDPRKKRFDPNTKPHHHLICTKCKRIEDVPADFDLPVSGACTNGFEVTGSHVEFYGLCPACK